jgi:phage shock protein A
MAYFHRLTDIVTCNLTALLEQAANPRAALDDILREMRDGLAGAQRSVATAESAANRLQVELTEHRRQIAEWIEHARTELTAGRDDQARLALVRKQEVDALVAGLEQQLAAAAGTRDHLTTTLRAMEARLADAVRRRQELDSDAAPDASSTPGGLAGSAPAPVPPPAMDDRRAARVEAELEALRQELQKAH